ncbi:MAG: hypothetical protein HQL38_17480 [Alphaproteobacteria bacterium]|nr:hypothetical protein [Alphaproteobacteria bacterium]
MRKLLLLADSYQEAGLHGEAETLWRTVLEAEPDHPLALARLALLLRAVNRSAEALPLLERLVAGAPERLAYRIALAETLGMLDRHADAVAAWREVLSRDPHDGPGRLELARQLAFTGDRDGAIAEAAAAVSREPTSPEALRLLDFFLKDAARHVERSGPEAVTPAAPRGGKRPLTILWRRTVLEIAQSEWLYDVLLARLDRPLRILVHEDDAHRPFLDDCLVPVFNTQEARSWFEEAKRRGHRNLGLYHMGDEYGQHDLAVYDHADWIIRNYLRAPTPERAVWVPTGWRNGVGGANPAHLPPMALRGITALFAGGIDRSPARLRMVEVIERHRLPCSIHKTAGFGRGYGPSQYAALLGDSRFALLPSGNVPDESIRLYDCLEMGCVPLLPHAPRFFRELGDPPFPEFPSWDHLPEVLRRDWSGIQETADAIQVWWRAYKRRIGVQVEDLIERSFASTKVD